MAQVCDSQDTEGTEARANINSRNIGYPGRPPRDDRQTVINYCLDRVADFFESVEKATKEGARGDNFLSDGHGENLIFILAQAELPPHHRTKRLLEIAKVSSPYYNTSDLRRLTRRLAGVANSEPASEISPVWQTADEESPLSDSLDDLVETKRWPKASKLVVDWWVAAKLRRDEAQMTAVQSAAAKHLDQQCCFVAVANKFWRPDKPAELRIIQEDRIYYICHLFFVLSNWCREAPLVSVAPVHRLRRWLAYMHEVYTIVMRNIEPRAQEYAVEIVVELAMCLRLNWSLYGDDIQLLTARLVRTPVKTMRHGFVVMPNNNGSYHGTKYMLVADYHTHCLVAFFLTHSCAERSVDVAMISR
jgi:hypothetical protein